MRKGGRKRKVRKDNIIKKNYKVDKKGKKERRKALKKEKRKGSKEIKRKAKK